ncbi:MAG: UDP-N-acetylglucosamine 1-carboxyvinyltransferase [Clostridia bacterium]|nr:UDP-N-acetylglucosamine 1-carboxyvinyltransferase [Clostridia bacterium]
MAVLKINGGNRLYGETVVQGAKNSALPCLAAAALGRRCIIHNCPDLTDTKAGLKILNALGVKTEFKDNTVITNAPKSLLCSQINDSLMKEMRSSVMFLGAILSKCGEAEISYPGGCSIGARPIDLHLKAFSQMGASIREENGRIFCKVEKLKDAKIKLDFPSVGATENIMLLGAVSDCEFEIENPAREPEILDLRNFLNSMGGNISEDGNGNILIKGVSALYDTEYKIIPDRIAALTYLCGIAGCGGQGKIKCVRPDHIKLPLKILEAAGNDIKCGEDYIEIKSPKRMKSFGIINTMPYPDFPTDAQAVFMAASLRGKGESCFVENIFENRFGHIAEFEKMGANIKTYDNSACVSGVKRLGGAKLYAKDLRGGAALVVAALSAKGESVIYNTEFIDRGYENIERSFCDFGGEIVREE